MSEPKPTLFIHLPKEDVKGASKSARRRLPGGYFLYWVEDYRWEHDGVPQQGVYVASPVEDDRIGFLVEFCDPNGPFAITV